MANTIKVILKKPGQKPETVEVPNELKPLQELVGGYIETVTLADMGLVIMVNEDGMYKGLPNNCGIITTKGVIPHLLGNVVLCGVDGDEFADFPDELEATSEGKGETRIYVLPKTKTARHD